MGYKLNRAYIGTQQVRPREIVEYLCFTAEQANSVVTLYKNFSPAVVSLETSTDGQTWTDYTIGTDITLASVWDKVYRRNKSTTPTEFSKKDNNYYYFSMSWKIAASWDITTLLCKKWTDTLTGASHTFYKLFYWRSSLTTPPKLPATTLTDYCYNSMFEDCTGLTTAPHLPATSLPKYCYSEMFYWCSNLVQLPYIIGTTMGDMACGYMFYNCSNIKIASSSNSTYTQAYRIPKEDTGTTGTNSLYYMFRYTGGTFTGSPTINTTYYAHKDIVLV